MADHAFYLPEGNGFRATELSRGPWAAEHQHGGPPAALLARAIEAELSPEMAVARLSVEFLRPIPLYIFQTELAILRRGRKVSIFTASLRGAKDAVEAVRARALAIRRSPLELPDPAAPSGLPGPEASKPFVFPFFADKVGYHTAMEGRVAKGRFGEGALAMWMRMRHPLLPGERPTPLQRVVIAADSGNGVSAALDTRRYSFVNADLTVHLHRYPAGEWVCLDARTVIEPTGLGLAESALHDEQGPLGRSLQSLVVERR